MTAESAFEADLAKGPANFQPLTPLGFLERAAAAFPKRTAVAYGGRRTGYRDFYTRCRRLAGALDRRGLGAGAVVTVMAPNVPALLEAHFGVPMAGAVLNPLNVRLDPATIAGILEHGGARLVICDRAYGAVMTEALERLGRAVPVIAIDDDDGPGGELANEADYETFLETGAVDFQWARPADEWQAISLNYTSGTTAAPKGVVYHHRGAYLNALGNAIAWSMPAHPVYLWTLPMFHCSGWCFPWTVTALGGTHVCLREVEPAAIFAAIEEHAVTHFCGAPRGPQPAGQRAGLGPAAGGANGRGDDGGLGATRRHHRGDRGDGLSHHPCLRAHRGLRAGGGVRLAPGMGCAGPRRARPAKGASRGSLSGARWPDGRRSPDHGGGAGGRRDPGRGDDAGQHRHEGLLEGSRGHRGILRARLVPQRRSRGHARRRLHRTQGPLERHHHLGRRKHLDDRGRGGPVPSPRRPRGRGRRQARRKVGARWAVPSSP